MKYDTIIIIIIVLFIYCLGPFKRSRFNFGFYWWGGADIARLTSLGCLCHVSVFLWNMVADWARMVSLIFDSLADSRVIILFTIVGKPRIVLALIIWNTSNFLQWSFELYRTHKPQRMLIGGGI